MATEHERKASNCNVGCRLPFLSFFEDLFLGPPPVEKASTTETLLEIITSQSDSDADFEETILPVFEELLDSQGLECVVFLPTQEGTPTGKKCVVRSSAGDPKGEIRLRTKGEMKKIKFEWGDISNVSKGRSSKLTAQMTVSESYEPCFLHYSIEKRGVINLMFQSEALRDASLLAIQMLVRLRGKEDVEFGRDS